MEHFKNIDTIKILKNTFLNTFNGYNNLSEIPEDLERAKGASGIYMHAAKQNCKDICKHANLSYNEQYSAIKKLNVQMNKSRREKICA